MPGHSVVDKDLVSRQEEESTLLPEMRRLGMTALIVKRIDLAAKAYILHRRP